MSKNRLRKSHARAGNPATLQKTEFARWTARTAPRPGALAKRTVQAMRVRSTEVAREISPLEVSPKNLRLLALRYRPARRAVRTDSIDCFGRRVMLIISCLCLVATQAHCTSGTDRLSEKGGEMDSVQQVRLRDVRVKGCPGVRGFSGRRDGLERDDGTGGGSAPSCGAPPCMANRWNPSASGFARCVAINSSA
jgi:hypothetical protein